MKKGGVLTEEQKMFFLKLDKKRIPPEIMYELNKLPNKGYNNYIESIIENIKENPYNKIVIKKNIIEKSIKSEKKIFLRIIPAYNNNLIEYIYESP